VNTCLRGRTFFNVYLRRNHPLVLPLLSVATESNVKCDIQQEQHKPLEDKLEQLKITLGSLNQAKIAKVCSLVFLVSSYECRSVKFLFAL
jgi:hypothetical protein